MELKLYAVMNHEGKWLRAKGFGGYGETWIKDIQKAKFYGRIGPARGRVTFFAKRWTNHPVPEIVEITSTDFKVLDEKNRVANVDRKEKMRAAKAELARKKKEIEDAHSQLIAAEKKIRELEEA